jgi:hypothetical protein
VGFGHGHVIDIALMDNKTLKKKKEQFTNLTEGAVSPQLCKQQTDTDVNEPHPQLAVVSARSLLSL